MDSCGDRLQLDAWWETDEVKDFLAKADTAKGAMNYADVTRQRYYQRRDELPEKKEDPKARVKTIDEYPSVGASSAVAAPPPTPSGVPTAAGPTKPDDPLQETLDPEYEAMLDKMYDLIYGAATKE